LCSKIENEEEAFLNTKDISIENGYLVTKRYKEKTIIDVKGIEIGGEEPVVISGPCSVESEEIVRNIAIGIKKAGADILRGGAFKPRTSPYDFQGLGRKGIDILNKISKELDIPVVTEIMDIRELDYMIDKVDILQVGARNMYNYSLLKELGKVDKPILLKRGLSATIKEFLLSAEYIMLGGNGKVILCERGIRTYENYTRNTMDIAAISFLKNMTHLPIIADPSHATGKRELIGPLSKASISAGADGIIIESHLNPENAWSDGKQTI
ncbi:TPA: 3-deoxy-7-phosphoheptulonate synthase, partial [Enterococcus faecium]|nr:3-deoxy-7-phosphoheptulonate synthase [Enterococcus faecium]